MLSNKICKPITFKNQQKTTWIAVLSTLHLILESNHWTNSINKNRWTVFWNLTEKSNWIRDLSYIILCLKTSIFLKIFPTEESSMMLVTLFRFTELASLWCHRWDLLAAGELKLGHLPITEEVIKSTVNTRVCCNFSWAIGGNTMFKQWVKNSYWTIWKLII